MKKILVILIYSLCLSISSTPYAQAADTVSPQLVDWTLQDISVDISMGDGKATVKFILSDESEIAVPNLLLKSLDTTQMTPFATVKEITRSGKLVSYEATAIIKMGQAPKSWQWVLYPLRDNLGNSSASFGPESKWVSLISVTDANYTREKLAGLQTCQRIIIGFNKMIERVDFIEKKFPGYADIEIARLKYSISKTKLEDNFCETQDYSTGNRSRLEDKYGIGVQIQMGEVLDVVMAKGQEAKDIADAQAAKEQEAKDAQTVRENQAKIAADSLAIKNAQQKSKKTILCFKGKLTKKVTAVKPVCPKGYKQK
jgi:hypothetical protein